MPTAKTQADGSQKPPAGEPKGQSRPNKIVTVKDILPRAEGSKTAQPSISKGGSEVIAQLKSSGLGSAKDRSLKSILKTASTQPEGVQSVAAVLIALKTPPKDTLTLTPGDAASVIKQLSAKAPTQEPLKPQKIWNPPKDEAFERLKVDIITKIPTYGNYGGEGWTAGCATPCTLPRDKAHMEPINQMDIFFQGHDTSYTKADDTYRNSAKTLKDVERRLASKIDADTQLIRDLKTVKVEELTQFYRGKEFDTLYLRGAILGLEIQVKVERADLEFLKRIERMKDQIARIPQKIVEVLTDGSGQTKKSTNVGPESSRRPTSPMSASSGSSGATSSGGVKPTAAAPLLLGGGVGTSTSTPPGFRLQASGGIAPFLNLGSTAATSTAATGPKGSTSSGVKPVSISPTGSPEAIAGGGPPGTTATSASAAAQTTSAAVTPPKTMLEAVREKLIPDISADMKRLIEAAGQLSRMAKENQNIADAALKAGDVEKYKRYSDRAQKLKQAANETYALAPRLATDYAASLSQAAKGVRETAKFEMEVIALLAGRPEVANIGTIPLDFFADYIEGGIKQAWRGFVVNIGLAGVGEIAGVAADKMGGATLEHMSKSKSLLTQAFGEGLQDVGKVRILETSLGEIGKFAVEKSVKMLSKKPLEEIERRIEEDLGKAREKIRELIPW